MGYNCGGKCTAHSKKARYIFFWAKKQNNLSKESKNMGIYYAAFVQLMEEEKPQELGKSTEKILQRAGNAYFRAEKVIATNLACVIIVLRNAICAWREREEAENENEKMDGNAGCRRNVRRHAGRLRKQQGSGSETERKVASNRITSTNLRVRVLHNIL